MRLRVACHPHLRRDVEERATILALPCTVTSVEPPSPPLSAHTDEEIESLVSVDLVVMPQPVPSTYELLVALYRGARIPVHYADVSEALDNALDAAASSIRQRADRYRDESDVAERGYSLNGIGLANAAALDDDEAVAALLRLEVSPNSRDARGIPAAHRAARARAWAALELLLDAGLDQSAVADDRGTTLLLELAPGARIDLVARCLEQGAPIDVQSSAGQTALMGAIGARQQETALLLLDHGADTTPVDQLGMSAASYARMFGLTELAGRMA